MSMAGRAGRGAVSTKSWASSTPGRLAALSALALLPIAMRSERHYRSLPGLEAEYPSGPLPALSIIVPARDEAANLPDLLDSLCTLHYPGRLEIIVVDDGSKDGTGEIAASYGVHVVRNDNPSPGWTGKTHACHRGAQASSGEWLLFVDADTRHYRRGPARSVAFAVARELHGLSLFLPNASSGAADRLALMVAFASFFSAVGPSSSVLNGQFILLRRDVYEDSQGFSAVRDQVTEDLALGNRLRAMGYHIPIFRGDGIGTVRMYEDTSQLWPGLSRFAVASLRWTGASGLWAILLTILVAAPVEFLLWALFSRQGLWGVSLAWATTALAMSGWAARFGGRRWTLLAPLGGLQVQFAAIYGIVRRLLGRGVPWKGRVL